MERTVEVGVSFLDGSNFSLWKVRLEAYFIFVKENIFLSIEYGFQDEHNEKSKRTIFKGVTPSSHIHPSNHAK